MDRWRRNSSPSAVRAWLTVAAIAAVAGCYPGDISSISETQVVVTAYDGDFDHSSQRTYAIPDTVVEVCDLEAPNPDLPIDCSGASRIEYDHEQDSVLVARIVRNMDALGYTRVPTDQVAEEDLPDVALLAMVAANSWTAYTGWGCGGYWGWWGWFPPGWRCWYPGGGTSTTWEQGTLFVDMLDPDGATEERIPSVWIGAVNAVLGSSGQQNLDLALDGIDQAFDQSSDYLLVR